MIEKVFLLDMMIFDEMRNLIKQQQDEIAQLKKEIGELRKHQARLRSWLQEGCC